MDDPLVFRPPPRYRVLQLVIGLPLSALLVGVAGLVTFLMWVPHQVRYSVAGGELKITTGARPFLGRRTVPLADIVRADPRTVRGGRKVNGTNLPGYCVGVFFYPELGRVWQATDCSDEVVLLELGHDRRPWLLSPPDRDGFLAALGSGAPFEGEAPPPPPLSGWDAVMMAMPVLTLGMALLTPALFIWAPRRLRYRIHPDGVDAITILRTRRFATVGCTARRHRPRVGIRLWGTAIPGYYTGWFRADHTYTRLYATATDDGVLIEGEHLRLFLSPQDPEAFLAALRSTGATA